jgi:hypothetical protein
MALIFGLDVSHHQDTTLDFAAFRRDGIEFAFIKSSEGSTFTDPQFTANLARARAAGMLVAAYHYVRSDASAAGQAARVARTVSRDVPVILDVESGSGSVSLVRAVTAALQSAGYQVPLLYLPRWYWQQIGSPPLDGLPPLWSSRYPDNAVGTLLGEYAMVPASYWNGYGGLPVRVLQFTSSARVAGRSPLDANAFKGTREQLATVLGGGQENDMQATDLVVDPATGKPALDVNGNPFSYNAAIFYTNKAVWDLVAQVAELKSRPAADVDEVALADALAAKGVTGITPDQVRAALADVLRQGTDPDVTA